MRLFAIGDPHLSFGCDKPMDIFKGWHDHVSRFEENWNKTVSAEDTVVVCGDISWAMTMKEAQPDFAFLDRLNGRKISLRGNCLLYTSPERRAAVRRGSDEWSDPDNGGSAR